MSKWGLLIVSPQEQDSLFLGAGQSLLSWRALDGSNGNLPAMQETQVQSLGQEDPLEKEMATLVAHSSILAWRILWTLAWRILWTEEPDGL